MSKQRGVGGKRGALGAIIVAAGAFGGCRQHLTLQAPDQNASFKARVEAYADLQPFVARRSYRPQVMQGPFASNRISYLELADGRRVHFVEDILPIVPESSLAAIAARDSYSNRVISQRLLTGGGAGMLGGFGLALVPLVVHLRNDGGDDGFPVTPMIAGGILILASAAVLLAGAVVSGHAQEDA